MQGLGSTPKTCKKIIKAVSCEPRIRADIMKKEKNIVYELCGLPGSGKSTWAKTQVNAEIISSDSIRAELYGSEEIQGNGQEVFDLYYKRLEAALREREKDIILDATNISVMARSRGIAITSNYNNYDIIAVVFKANADKCLEQQKNRERQVPEDVVRGMASRWQEPSLNEGFKAIIKI